MQEIIKKYNRGRPRFQLLTPLNKSGLPILSNLIPGGQQ
jgi:hypothetical protein